MVQTVVVVVQQYDSSSSYTIIFVRLPLFVHPCMPNIAGVVRVQQRRMPEVCVNVVYNQHVWQLIYERRVFKTCFLFLFFSRLRDERRLSKLAL